MTGIAWFKYWERKVNKGGRWVYSLFLLSFLSAEITFRSSIGTSNYGYDRLQNVGVRNQESPKWSRGELRLAKHQE